MAMTYPIWKSSLGVNNLFHLTGIDSSITNIDICLELKFRFINLLEWWHSSILEAFDSFTNQMTLPSAEFDILLARI